MALVGISLNELQVLIRKIFRYSRRNSNIYVTRDELTIVRMERAVPYVGAK